METPDMANRATWFDRSPEKYQRFRFTPRDFDYLEEIWRHRYLTVDLLAQIFPKQTPDHLEASDRPTHIENRVRPLFHLGYLDKKRDQDERLRDALVYSITDLGIEKLSPARPHLQATKRTKQQARPNIPHDLSLAQIYAALILASRHRRSKDFHFDEDERASWKRDSKKPLIGTEITWKDRGRRYAYSPDALTTITDTRPRTYAIETDMGTMNHTALIRKFDRLGHIWKHELHRKPPWNLSTGFAVLFVTTSTMRRDNIAEMVNGLPASQVPTKLKQLLWFASRTEFQDHPTNINSTIWRRASAPGTRVNLRGEPLPLKQS